MTKAIAGMETVAPAEEKVMENNYLELIRELIHERLGIHISHDKSYLLEHKLSRILAKGNYSGIADLYQLLKDRRGEAMEDLVRYVTTTHTFFFREHKHLSILRNDIRLRKIARPLIWVAAAATGEEVYSITIELLESGITDFFLVASDINRDVLLTCKRGVYSRDRMKELPEPIIGKYFAPCGAPFGHYRVKDILKKNFIVKKINLIEDVRFEEQFDYIFCRNVLIYFDLETQRRVLDVLINNLKDLGYLFVGHSESLFNVTNKLESVFSSVYNKKL